MAKLILKFKGVEIREYPLDKPSMRIGRREGNDIMIDNLAVSGNHAKIRVVNGSYVIVDLKSTNGTMVNGRKVAQAKLFHMDEITVGRHTLIFFDEAQPQRDPRAPEQPDEDLIADTDAESLRRSAGTQEIFRAARIEFLEPAEHPDMVIDKKLTVIGRREDADIRLKGPFSPKVAAFINRRPHGYSILPEEKAKVKVNGEFAARQIELADGDIIEIGSLKLLFRER